MDLKNNNPPESLAIHIEEDEETCPANKQKAFLGCLGSFTKVVAAVGMEEKRRLIHGAKVGLALVLVSLLYMLEPVHDRLGDNAMWAVMTVVVVFEFTAGATISKGLNRGLGTILGGGLGSLMALLAQEIGGVGKVVAIGTSVFLFGGAGTYTRMAPSIKKKYDYGVMIFILTFSLIAISGVRGDQIIDMAVDRLSSICMGFAICVFISLFIFPVWAGDELHSSMASKFNNLAGSIQECMATSTNNELNEKTGKQTTSISYTCLTVLSSKTTDESMGNFAKWEPWHGRFGFYYPWKKYLEIGRLLRELAVSIHSLNLCLQFEPQPSPQCPMMGIKDRYVAACSLIVYTMRELGNNIRIMKSSQQSEIYMSKLQTIRSELCSHMNLPKVAACKNDGADISKEVLVTISSVFLLGEIADKLQELVKQVAELGKMAGFTD